MPDRGLANELILQLPADFAVVKLTSNMTRMKYAFELQTEDSLIYTRPHSPPLFLVAYVLAFPIGLLLMLFRPKLQIVVSYWQLGDGSTRFTTDTDDRVVVRFFELAAERPSLFF
jgi:hypothetical protein